jgi:hypothetical protein
MKDYLELSSVPCDEPCAAVGESDYSTRARLECRAFIDQLERQFPQAVEAGCYFKTRSNAHDFGTYYEVAVVYDDEDEAQASAAFEIEGNLPMAWDDDARNFLAAHGYSIVPAGWGKVSV